MNYYIVVEGPVEKNIYRSWIPLINPKLSYCDDLMKITDDNFYIVSGDGYPNYLNIISNGIEDVNNTRLFQKMVISVDAEEMSYEEKLHELQNFTAQYPCISPIAIIIQFFCIETWGLGNRLFPRRTTTDKNLQIYYDFYNIVNDDPEQMPSIDPENYTRAQFAYKYLRKVVNDRNPRLTYSKSNPTVLTQNGYFEQIRKRLYETNHLSHFQEFIDAFT